MLSHRHPERWADTTKVRVEVDKELERALDALEGVMTPDAYVNLIDSLAAISSSSSEAS